MTLDLQTSRVVFKGNGAAVEFPFDFKVWDASQIAVFVSDDPDGINEMEVTPQKVILTESGGTVTYTLEGKPLPEGYTLSIVRNMPFIQEDMYITGTRFNPEVIETRFDKDCAERQQILEMLSRCIKVSVTSDMTPEQLLKAIFKAYHDILESLASTGSITGAIPVVATGTTEPRPLKDRFADIVNVKDFGAKGDGVTDDTEAWGKWQAALEKGGIGYVPSGAYLVNGIIRYFVSGCFGNGIDKIISTALDENESMVANHYGDTGPIVQIYRNYADWENFSPFIDLSFDANATKNNDWHVNGSGPQGIQVRGTAKGNGNTMPIGIRSFMQNKLNGDGDSVAIWGRVVKESPEGGTNDSDSCGVHCSAWNFSDTGAGLVMASEHWAKQGSTRENEPHLMGGAQIGIPDGALVCQHINANSSVGMAHALLLLAGGSEGYGAWNGIQIGRVFDRAGEHGVDHTVGINCGSWLKDYGYPMYGIQFGYCPNHVRMIGAYSYNIKADMTIFRNQTDANNAIVVINKDTGDGYASFALQHKGVAVSDIITQVGNVDTYYRVRQNGGHHAFYAQDSEGTLKRVCSIGTIAVFPGTDNEVSLGWSSNRWTQVFASTGSISTSDERLKQDISAIPDSVFKAWEKVNFQQFKFKDAVKKKGDEARLHSGLIAQRIIEAFKEEGLDASEYGLLCYDEWPAEEAVIERVKVVDREETYNEDGSIREPEQFHYEENVLSPAREAGDCYSVRYEEALCLEAAYQRRRAERIEARLAALETKLGVV